MFDSVDRRALAKINRVTKSLRLGISEDEKLTFGNEKIDQADSFTYLGSIISKGGGSSEVVKNRIANAQGIKKVKNFFS